MSKFLELNRHNFLLIYLLIKDKGWDELYSYRKLLDIFGRKQLDSYESKLFYFNEADNDEIMPDNIKFDNELPTLQLEYLERIAILKALKKAHWKQKDAAKLLGISFRALNYKISELGLKHPSWRKNTPKKNEYRSDTDK